MRNQSALDNLYPLYQTDFERDNCGFGIIANVENIASRSLVSQAISSLRCMTHRGGLAADGITGDGCGLSIRKPHEFFIKITKELGINLRQWQDYAVGMVFLSQDKAKRDFAKKVFTETFVQLNLEILGWRSVAVNSEVLGQQAGMEEPVIEQIFIGRKQGLAAIEFNRLLFRARRRIEIKIKQEGDDEDFYVASLHSDLITYKGLLMPNELSHFYLDLEDKDFTSSLISYHQRFSTNTLPRWKLAQPFRFLAHNGELNTIKGNRNWVLARGKVFSSKLIPDMQDLTPLVSQSGSDSASLDQMLELLHFGGFHMFKAIRTCIPAAWQNDDLMSPELKAFFEYHSSHQEAWDGPAGMVINTGRYGIVALDRNGLRPIRYVLTKDQNITFASEIGVNEFDDKDVLQKGTLKPGQIMAVDLEQKRLIKNSEINNYLAGELPYKKWLDENVVRIDTASLNASYTKNLSSKQLVAYQKYFLLSFEEQEAILKTLATTKNELTASMGDDIPMAVLSKQERNLFDYFRQMFAQVTNPPIDSLRESHVMSLETSFGKKGNILLSNKILSYKDEQHEEIVNDFFSEDDAISLSKVIKIATPILRQGDFEAVLKIHQETSSLGVKVLYLNYDSASKSLKQALSDLADEAQKAVNAGCNLLVLDDECLELENKNNLVIHCLLATGIIHRSLVAQGLRSSANILVKSAFVRDAHHSAVLLAFGASAIYPYMVYETLSDLHKTMRLATNQSVATYIDNYIYAINKGLLKILSKMGISTISSYRASQLFEIIGLADEVVDLCFKGATSRIAGADFSLLEEDYKQRIKKVLRGAIPVDQGGLLKFVYGYEQHAFNPTVVDSLRKLVRNNNFAAYLEYANLVDERDFLTLRDLLKVKTRPPLDLSEVEPIEAILKRFDSAGISLGALSTEAHESIAIAMNTLGGRSNSGEGGEDSSRFGTIKNSKIKQVASGRFGVTAAYLRSAEVIQIKIAQGAKPGEGGQLPGEKVDLVIGALRGAVAGTTLISPPPHHDIYSIEDLAQLIFDLKQVNPKAKISVKLVSAPGVGTIAAGVAKAYADFITISGYDGGTGASPISSIRYAGNPFELGIAEANKVLRANDLRGQVVLQADGGLKTGLDVIKAAILGAESFGFGTAPMIAVGCKYLRSCHLNNCPVGIATQDETLRNEHYHGKPEMVMQFFKFIAEDVRRRLAEFGFKSMDEIIGRVQLLEQIKDENQINDKNKKLTNKHKSLNLNAILEPDNLADNIPYHVQVDSNKPWDKAVLAAKIDEDTKYLLKQTDLLTDSEFYKFSYKIANTDRSIGAALAGEIAGIYGDSGLVAKNEKGINKIKLQLDFKGQAGQSFGAFNLNGVCLNLAGDANDYVGKSMNGGKIIIKNQQKISFDSRETPIIGNTCLYGARGGILYAQGVAGVRFAVRNSGALAVVEGMSDHGCEYMTGGVVVSLGEIDLNFGAGMSGGIAFVLNEKNLLDKKLNNEMVEAISLAVNDQDLVLYKNYLKTIISNYQTDTQSLWAGEILNNFDAFINKFVLIKPKNIDLASLFKNFAVEF